MGSKTQVRYYSIAYRISPKHPNTFQNNFGRFGRFRDFQRRMCAVWGGVWELIWNCLYLGGFSAVLFTSLKVTIKDIEMHNFVHKMKLKVFEDEIAPSVYNICLRA